MPVRLLRDDIGLACGDNANGLQVRQRAQQHEDLPPLSCGADRKQTPDLIITVYGDLHALGYLMIFTMYY